MRGLLMFRKVVLLGFVSVLLLSMTLPQIGVTSSSAYNKFGNSAPSIQLGLTIDGSGSIPASNFTVIKNGVAAAIRNNMPHNGTVELTVIQFGTDDATGARVEVSPTVINETNYDSVATTIENINQGGELTPMADGLYLTWVTINGSTNFETATTQVINVVTDGIPNVELQAISSPTGDAHNDTTWVRDMAAGQGLDKLDAEGIGAEVVLEWMWDRLVYPQPGTIAPPYTRDTGWVKWIATAEEFAEAFCQKFIILFPPEHELAVTLDFRASGLGATVHNYGSSNETGVELQLLINGSEVNSTTITELLTDSSYTLSYLWVPTVEGTYNITAYAPPVTGENFTANNVAGRIVEFELGHDVAVVNVVPSKTVVGQGYCLYFKVTVKNKGNFTETFHVFPYYDELVIPTPEQWEIFWSMGDVNRDGYIDWDDVDLIEDAWGSTPGSPNWNPDADLNKDLIVNTWDLAILADNFDLDIWTCLGLSPPTGGQKVSELVGYGTSTVVTVKWNATGVALGNYTINAYALLGRYDENSTNNNYVDGTIKVTIPADATGDGYVNIWDRSDMSDAWLTESGDPNYNPNVDFSCDGLVNIWDLQIMSDHWLTGA